MSLLNLPVYLSCGGTEPQQVKTCCRKRFREVIAIIVEAPLSWLTTSLALMTHSPGCYTALDTCLCVRTELTHVSKCEAEEMHSTDFWNYDKMLFKKGPKVLTSWNLQKPCCLNTGQEKVVYLHLVGSCVCVCVCVCVCLHSRATSALRTGLMRTWWLFGSLLYARHLLR